jgi:sugar diacid utilization regulator
MKAHLLQFHNLIDINPRTGIIQLHNRRMALNSTEALGILRRDLVTTLGMERAKGFLMRYGWACGFDDGEAIQKMFRWASKRELMLSGPSLHTLEGVVTVEVDKLEFDEHQLYFSGYWNNSYEVEEHIRHFGNSDSTVCWTLVGYTSGFLTNVFGKKVLVKEARCRGKKDDCCYFVAKTVEHWEEHEREDLRYYQAESLVSELDRVHHEICSLNQTIMRSKEIHKKLTELVLDGKSLAPLLSYLAESVNRSVVIEKSTLGEFLDGSFCSPHHEMAYRQREGPRDEPTAIDDFPLRAGAKQLGNLVVIGDTPLSQQERMIIEHAASVFTVQLFHERSIAQSIWKMKEDFFEEILDGKYDEDFMNRRAHNLDIDIDTHSYVLAMKVNPKEELENLLNYLLLKRPRLNAFLKQDAIVLFLPGRCDGRQADVKEFAAGLKELLEKKFQSPHFYIGVGREAHSLTELGRSYQDALRIAQFLQLSYPSDNVAATFDQMEPIILFLKGADQNELIAFCRKTIGKLIDYDMENKSNLLLTLKTYLDNNGNLHKTAKELHLSIAGLRYRLARLEELSCVSLKEGSGSFKLQLAVQIYFTLQLIMPKPFEPNRGRI